MPFDMQPVRSASGAHKEAGYDPTAQVMRVRFGSGQMYDYHGVTPEIYQASLEAPSFGSYLKRIIQPVAPASPVADQ